MGKKRKFGHNADEPHKKLAISSSNFSESSKIERDDTEDQEHILNLLTVPHLNDAIDSYTKVHENATELSEAEFPESISVLKFAQCRASEIASLMEDIKKKRPKLALQQLPHYMRRRAASHHANRVPRRLREKALREIQKAKKTKRPSRKHRRRPSNLLMEYVRRQRENTWLETHIWFAKRFKMSKLWGYVIPLYPNDKSLRAGFKASSEYVLLQDLSYMCCIQLMGSEQQLLEKLSLLTNNSTGLTFASKMYLSGSREGSVVLYNPNSFPYNPIGPVSFLWQPLLDIELRKLWIWCHPMMHKNLVEILRILFDLLDCQELHNEVTPSQYNQEKDITNLISYENEDVTNNERKENDDNKLQQNSTLVVQDKKLKHRFRRTTTYSRNGISLTLLKDALVRHRLLGPRSHTVITDALKPADIWCDNHSEDAKWWENYYSETNNKDLAQKQEQFLQKVQEQRFPDDMPPKSVLGLTVKDPRLDLPKVKKNVAPDPNYFHGFHRNELVLNIDPDISHSPLWDEIIRDQVTATKVPENQLNKMRSQFLVPGTRLEHGRDEARIPVIVIQQPGVNGFSSGWDVILPLGWSMPFWIAFIYRGARVFGLRQLRDISRDAGTLLFPFNYPDTECGKEWVETQRKAMMEKYFRYPPAKRPHFQKLGILTPYFMPYNTLVANWIHQLPNVPVSNESHEFFILRTKKELRQLQEIGELLKKLSKLRYKDNKYLTAINAHLKLLESKLLNSNIKNSLICIKIQCSNKGRPTEHSGLYMPNDSDFMMLKQSLQFRGPAEQIHDVPKILKQKSKKRRKRKTENQKLNDKVERNDKDNQRLVRPNVENLVDHCDRKLMGSLEMGNYSYLSGCGNGLGYCSLIAISELMKKCVQNCSSLVILLRSQKSLQYRLASVEIVTNVN